MRAKRAKNFLAMKIDKLQQILGKTHIIYDLNGGGRRPPIWSMGWGKHAVASPLVRAWTPSIIQTESNHSEF